MAEGVGGRRRPAEPRSIVAFQRALVGPTGACPPRPSLALTDAAPRPRHRPSPPPGTGDLPHSAHGYAVATATPTGWATRAATPPGAPAGAGAPPPPPPATFAPSLPPGYQGYTSADIGQLAGFWIRFASWLLDSILYGLLAAVFIVPAIIIGVNAFDGCKFVDSGDFNETQELLCPPGTPDAGPVAAAVALGVIGLLIVLFIYVRALGRGQTWGMRITNIRLVRSDNGMPVGFGKALGRTLFANIVSANVFYLGYLWAAWDDRKQTWQDKIVSSYVVRN